MEPIAQGIAARGHDVHMVLPWHPQWTRGASEHGVTFHLFRYAPAASMNVFGYASALREDVACEARQSPSPRWRLPLVGERPRPWRNRSARR